MEASIAKDSAGGSALRAADAPFDMTIKNTPPLALDALGRFEAPQLLFGILIRGLEIDNGVRVVDRVHLALKR